MAYISLNTRTTNSLTVCLSGLDDTYYDTIRKVDWYLDDVWKGQTVLNTGIKESLPVKFSSLSASREYTVKCIISNIQNYPDVHLTAKFWTLDAAPTIDSFTVTQTAVGERRAQCVWSVSNYVSGATKYVITVNGYSKASGTITSSSGSATISFDNFQNYKVKFELWTNDEYAYSEYNVNIVESELGDSEFQGEIIIDRIADKWINLYITGLNTSLLGSDNIADIFISTGDYPNPNFGANPVTINIPEDSDTSYIGVINGLSPSTKYYCLVLIYSFDHSYSPIGQIKTTFTTASEDVTPTNLRVTNRSHNRITLGWDAPTAATSGIIRITRKWDSEIILEKNRDSGFLFFYEGEWEYGVTYTVDVKCGNDYNWSDWTFGYDLTTNPSPPTISLSQNNNYIVVDYGVKKTTNVSIICFSLYNDSGEWIEDGSVAISEGDRTPSGAFQFSTPCESGSYYVRAYTMLHINNTSLQCLTSDGNNYVEVNITINGESPELWEWTTNISPTSVIPYDAKGFHPVTAEEWNRFTAKINEVRECLSKFYSEYSTKYTFTTVYGASNGYSDNPTEFTAAIYNEAANRIIELSYYSGLDYDVSSIEIGREVTASLFTNLSNQLNFLINNL